MSSPRAWGCFWVDSGWTEQVDVFPTCVGVFLYIYIFPPPPDRLPHVRGGVSWSHGDFAHSTASSPRAWGCFSILGHTVNIFFVFPTCVGVFLSRPTILWRSNSLPHVRGGVSSPRRSLTALAMSSPRAWGCFRGPSHGLGRDSVFPTCVGVFLRPKEKSRKK